MEIFDVIGAIILVCAVGRMIAGHWAVSRDAEFGDDEDPASKLYWNLSMLQMIAMALLIVAAIFTTPWLLVLVVIVFLLD